MDSITSFFILVSVIVVLLVLIVLTAVCFYYLGRARGRVDVMEALEVPPGYAVTGVRYQKLAKEEIGKEES